jgi:hypothetical protein
MIESDLLLFAHRFINTQLVDGAPFTALGEPGNKLTMALLHKKFKTLSSRESNEELSVQLLDDVTATLHYCLMFHRPKPLTQIFIRKIDQLISSGIVRRIEEQESTRDQQPARYRDQEAQPLTMDHLGVGFVVILSFLVLSCVAFLIECLTKFFINFICRKLGELAGIF